MKMKMTVQTPQMQQRQSSRGKYIATQAFISRSKIGTQYSIRFLEKKQQIKPEAEEKQIRAEIMTQNEETEQINKSKIRFFEIMNKIDNPQPDFSKRKERRLKQIKS